MTLVPMCPRSLVSTAMPDAPSAMQRPEQVVGREFDVGEEHLVELGLAGHLPERADLDAGKVHRAQEERDALVLGARLAVGVGARHEDAPVAVPAAASTRPSAR